jgi:glycosyltransferase involved in cell wall biosynthesis
MRVALACDWFLKYAAAQAAALARAGAQVLLLCRTHAEEFGRDPSERERALEDARRAGVLVLELPGRLSDPRAAAAVFRLRRQVRGFAPQLVHVHDGTDPRMLPLLAGPPTVLTLHDPAPHPGQPLPGARKRWFLHGSRDLWRARASVIVVHSERLRDQLVLDPQQRAAVIAHGLHIAPRPLEPPPRPTVGFFGRLAPYKGLEVLARAMPCVWTERPEVHLRVRGSGESTLPLADSRVTVEREYLPESELWRFFASISLAALPYTQASQSGVGSVAAGYGVPAIVTALGGLADLALDQSYVVHPGDEQALARAILAHIDDGAEVRERILREVAAPRSWDAVAVQSIELYESVVRAHR